MISHSSRKIITIITTLVLFFFVTYFSFAATADVLPETDIISEAFLDSSSTGSVSSGSVFTGSILTETLLPEVSTGDILVSESVISSGEPLSGIISSGATLSGSLSGSGASGSVVVAPPIDYSTYSYYSGTWTQDGTTYGNSYYPDSLGLPKRIAGVQIYTYDEYNSLQAQSPKTKKQKQGLMSASLMKEAESMTMSAMSAPTNGLLAEYIFDGDANDTGGYGYNGTPIAMSWPFMYSGSTQKVAKFLAGAGITTNNTSIGAGATTMSWSFWIQPPPVVGEYTTILNKGLSGGNPTTFYMACTSPAYQSNAGKYYFFYNNGGAHEFFSNASCPADTGIWTHIVFTYSAGTVSMYRNGVLDRTMNIGGTALPSSARGLDIGWGNFPNSGIQGSLHSLRIYDHVLTASEIQYLYTGNPPAPGVTNDTNLPYTNPAFLDPTKTFVSTSGHDNHVAISNEVCKKTDADSAKTATDEKNLADPVNLATGEFAYDNTLMNIPGVGLPYQLKIQYKNQATYNGPLGFNWDHNYNQYLSGETNGNVLYYNGQLGTFRFIKSGATWIRNEGLRATLVLSGSIYSINYDNGNKANFNSINRLGSLQDINGNTLNFTYSGSYLSGVTDTLGRTMSYSYYSHNRLKTVTDFSGRKADFIYYTGSTASGNLYDLANIVLTNSGVTKTIGFEYSTATTDPLSHNITRLIDAKGQIYVENTYTAEDRVATQKYGSASLGYTYTLSGSQITQNTVLDKLGNRTDYTYDASGNNTSIRYYNPTQSSSVFYSYTYNSLGLMTGEKRPRGNGYTYAYDANGNLIQKRFKANVDLADSASDLVTTSTYNARNEKMTETNPNNTQIIYTRDTKGNILTKSLSGAVDYLGATIAPMTTTYTYFPSGLLQTNTSAEGRITQYGYTSGQLTSLSRGTGGEISISSFVYSPYGTVSSATDGDGFTKNYGYTVFDLVSTGTTAEGLVTSYAYDANNNKTRETRYITGGTVNSYYYYDSLDHLTSSVVDTKAGQTVTTTYIYDNNGNVTDKKIGNGSTVHYTYNEFSKPTEERILLVPGDSAKDIVTSYTYDTNNNLITKTDPRGYTTTYTYDLYDRITQETNTQGTYTTYLYNRDNTIDTTSTYTSTGLILTKNKTLYDNYGHITKLINYLTPASSTNPVEQKYIYNKDFDVINNYDENNAITTNYYDSRGNITQTIDSMNNSSWQNYNKRDMKISIGSWSNNINIQTNYIVDRDGRITRSTNYLGKYKSFIYDNLGSIVKSTDEMGRVTDIERDYRGLMTKSTSYSGAISSVTIYTYDERGNMMSILDPMNHTTSYQYDGINRNTKIIYPDLKEVTNTYDKSSNLISRTDPNGTVVTNTYDSVNRLISRNILTGSGVGGVTNEGYAYDALGRLTSGGDNLSGSLTFTYDALSRLNSEYQRPTGGTGYTVGYTYSITSDLTGVVLPDGKIQTYTYDKIHRLLSTTYSGQVISTNTYTGILQDKTIYGNGKITNYSYDTINRITSMNAGSSIPVPTYTYNDSSDILGDGTKSYTYDGLARLIGATSASTGASTESYIYDKTGNRTIGVLATNTTNYTTNTLDQYTLLTGSTNSGTLTYDNNGNLKTEGNKTYIYDYNNRLIEVNIGTGNLVKYSYDILGRRTKKSTSTETIVYIYSGDNILSEYKTIGSGSLTLKKNYINGIGTDNVIAYDVDESTNQGQISFCQNRVLPYSSEFTTYGYTSIVNDCNNAQNSSTGIVTKRYYYHTNQLGSVIALTNSTGTVMQVYSYDSFGRAYVSNSGTLTSLDTYSGSTYSNSRLYTGREYDKEIGMYYLRARYYNANTGKFISRDPVGQNDQINLYTYVKNNPLGYTDRDGRKASAAIASTWNYAKYVVDSIAEGGAKGDFIQNPNGWNTAGQIGAGFIPIYGQGADLRDTGAAWNSCSGGWSCAGKLSLAGVGFIPFAGDLIKLGAKGTKYIDPSTVHFTQDTISRTFKNGESVEDLTLGLKAGSINPDSITPIRIFEKNGEILSLDNRRLKAFQDAGVNIPFIKASADEILNESWKFTSKNGGTSINFR